RVCPGADRQVRRGMCGCGARSVRDPSLAPVRLGRQGSQRAAGAVRQVPRAWDYRAGDLPARSTAGGAGGKDCRAAARLATKRAQVFPSNKEVAVADSVYRVTELIGTS